MSAETEFEAAWAQISKKVSRKPCDIRAKEGLDPTSISITHIWEVPLLDRLVLLFTGRIYWLPSDHSRLQRIYIRTRADE